jgi:23S rRNA pseudouridine1911/1915/1917 synthase
MSGPRGSLITYSMIETQKAPIFELDQRYHGLAMRHVVAEKLAEQNDDPNIAETLIIRGGLWIDGARIQNPDHIAQHGMRVSIQTPLGGSYRDLSFDPAWIIYEDDDLLVLNKPANVYVDVTPWDTQGNLFYVLGQYISQRDNPMPKLHLAHRLDRDTSGVLMVSKTPEINPAIQRSFLKNEIHKQYICLASGQVAEDEIDLTTGHGRTMHGLFYAYPAEHIGQMLLYGSVVKEMRTKFQVLRRDSHSSLVRAYPITGRTHQIRLHMAHLGHPLFGDVRYKGPGEWNGRPIGYHLLHAEHLSLPHPRSRLPFEVTAPAPAWVEPDWRND